MNRRQKDLTCQAIPDDRHAWSQADCTLIPRSILTGHSHSDRGRLCASSAHMIQRGEIPRPAKPGKQPVLRLGAEAVRLGLSVAKGV